MHVIEVNPKHSSLLTPQEEERQWIEYWVESERLGYFPNINGRTIGMYPHIFQNSARNDIYYGIYKNRDGEPRVFSLGTKDSSEARRIYGERLHRLLQKQVAKNSTGGFQTLQQWRDEYLDLKATAFTQKTKKTVRDSFNWLTRMMGNVNVAEICTNPEKLEKVFYSSQYPSGTRRKHYGHLSAAFKKLVQWKRIKENPFDNFEKPEDLDRKEKDYLRHDEFVMMIKHMSTTSFRLKRLRNICIVAEDSGMRSGEVRHLRKVDIDYVNKRLFVRITEAHSTKNKRTRWVSLTDRSLSAIQDQIVLNGQSKFKNIRNSDYIFVSERGKAISESTLCTDFREMREELLPERRGVTFHSFRHAYATFLANNGIMPFDLKVVMGHSSIKTTEQYYLHKGGESVSKANIILAQRTGNIESRYLPAA